MIRFREIVVCLLALLITAGCAAPKQMPSSGVEDLAAERLPESELEYLRVRLDAVAQEYVYRTYQRRSPGKAFSVVRGGTFEGTLLLRRPNGLYSLLDGTLTDKRFNRIVIEAVADGQQVQAWLHVASMPDGSQLVGVAPAIGDGELSLVILRTEDALTVFLTRELIGILPCIDQEAAEGTISGLVNCASSSDGGSGGVGGQVGGALDLLGEPDCGENHLGPVSIILPGYPPRRSGAQRAREIQREREQLSDYINNDLSGDREAQNVYRRLSGALAIEQRANERLAEAEAEADRHYRPGEFPTEEQRAAQRRAEARVRVAQSGVNEAERNRAQREREVRDFERTRRRPANGSDSEGDQGNGTSQPPIGGEEAHEDPRCQGRRVDAERGTLFTNPDFCGDDDMFTCLRREQDSLFGLTEGQCWRETGPDDAPRIVCGRTDRGDQLSADPSAARDRECEDGQFGCWTDPVAPITSSGKIAVRYVDVTPMAGILIGLCARGGCPRTR
jgi:hypothetical protein